MAVLRTLAYFSNGQYQGQAPANNNAPIFNNSNQQSIINSSPQPNNQQQIINSGSQSNFSQQQILDSDTQGSPNAP